MRDFWGMLGENVVYVLAIVCVFAMCFGVPYLAFKGNQKYQERLKECEFVGLDEKGSACVRCEDKRIYCKDN